MLSIPMSLTATIMVTVDLFPVELFFFCVIDHAAGCAVQLSWKGRNALFNSKSFLGLMT